MIVESDSVARDSDSSDNPSDSIATCLQDGGSNSQCTSTEVIGHSSSADPLHTLDNESNEMMGSMQEVTMRSKRRNSDRPHSVSCLSQLNDTRKVIRSSDEIANQGLANHSISESALNTLSLPTTPSTVSHSTSGTMKASESKSSLKKRRMRARKRLAVSTPFDRLYFKVHTPNSFVPRVEKVNPAQMGHPTAEQLNCLVSSLQP